MARTILRVAKGVAETRNGARQTGAGARRTRIVVRRVDGMAGAVVRVMNVAAVAGVRRERRRCHDERGREQEDRRQNSDASQQCSCAGGSHLVSSSVCKRSGML